MPFRNARRAACLVLLAALALPAGADPLRFFAVGDIPYLPGEDLLTGLMLSREVPRGTPFVVHVGDTKRGSSPCTDAALAVAADIFRVQPVPVVYTPGDNEWTDCHREGAGKYNPIERLGAVRRIYFGDPSVLRLAELDVTVPDPARPENYRFIHQGVMFVAVHVVGSYNNLEGDRGREYKARTAANRTHLRAAARAAKQAGARALVVIFHANPGFEKVKAPKGYGPFREDLLALLAAFPGPVLGLHGDTHQYRVDQPLTDPATGKTLTRFTRIEVPGSPTVGGVWIGIDPDAARPFTAELTYPDHRDDATAR